MSEVTVQRLGDGSFMVTGPGHVSVHVPRDVMLEAVDPSRDLELMAALEQAGVDNWEGYGHAYAIFRGKGEW